MAIIEFSKVSKIYKSGDHELRALDGVDATFDEGKFIVILGPSGAGKSTLFDSRNACGKPFGIPYGSAEK